jgi:RNA polymerase sigma-70 factor (subfamily 1)
MYRRSSTIRLLSRARDGSRSGLGDLLESYRPLLRHLAGQQIGLRLRVDMSESDLVQETMLTASRGLPDFRGSTESEFRAWLVCLLQSRLTDGLRKHLAAEQRRSRLRQMKSQPDVDHESQSPVDAAQLAEESELLAEAVMDLEPIDRTIIFARYMEQQSFESIAAEVDLPLATVWRRWNRAVEQLRCGLEPIVSREA